MDVLYTMLTLIAFSLLAIFLAICFIMMTIFKGKSIGNPKYAPVKGTVFNQLFYFKKLYDYHTQMAKSHPTIRLLAPNQSELYTIDVRNIEHILKTNFDKYSKGKYNQDIVTDLFGEGIFAVDGEKWKQQRKIASYEFSARVLRDFSCSVFRKNASKLVRVISEFSHEGLVFDMQDLQMRCALDSIFKVGFGTELNCLEGSSKEGTEFMKALDESNALIYWRYADPIWSLKRFLNIGGEAKLKKNVKLIDDFVNGVINTKKSQLELQHDSNVKEDILSRFLMESKKDQTIITDKYLRDIILSFMIAGKDTTANTLSWFFYMLCKNPLVEEKIVQEIRDVTCCHESELNNIDEFAANLTDLILDKMHYLHSALTETLRLYPVVPIDGRTADEPDVLPDGHKLEKGDGVYYLAYAMGRMSSIWGEDADEFRPERWINNGIFQPESPFKFVAFHAGPRMCLGKDFAYRQMKIVAMCLLNFFKFKLANGTQNVTYKSFQVEGWGGFVLKEKLKRIKAALKDWHLTHTQNLLGKILSLKNQIDMLEARGEVNVLSEEEVTDLHEISTELHSLSRDNASISWQQSRLLWLREGAANSKYFHAIMLGRRRRNAISSVVVGGHIVEGVANVRETVFSHFYNHFQAHDFNRVDDLQFRRLSFADGSLLTCPFREDEVKVAVWEVAVWDCDSFKSPALDGIHLGFIKDFWSDLKNDIMRFVSEFHRNGRLSKGINSTFIALISKIDKPHRLNDFRPIALVGCLYKILAKLLANRLRQAMGTVISETQSAFVNDI